MWWSSIVSLPISLNDRALVLSLQWENHYNYARGICYHYHSPSPSKHFTRYSGILKLASLLIWLELVSISKQVILMHCAQLHLVTISFEVNLFPNCTYTWTATFPIVTWMASKSMYTKGYFLLLIGSSDIKPNPPALVRNSKRISDSREVLGRTQTDERWIQAITEIVTNSRSLRELVLKQT